MPTTLDGRTVTREQMDRLLSLLGQTTTPEQHLQTALECLERIQRSSLPPGALLSRENREDIGTATGHVFVALNALKSRA
jgi:hypothetical protein